MGVTPNHPFMDGLFREVMKYDEMNHKELLGYPHDYGNLHIHTVDGEAIIHQLATVRQLMIRH